MDRINYAMVIASQALQKIIVTTLKKYDVIYGMPLSGDDKYILPYIKQRVRELTTYDALIIDLGFLKDTDDQIIEAIEAVRFFDDSIRIIILTGNRGNCFGLLRKCFLNGIYNLIPPGKYTEMCAQLEKAILTGITYKEALIFRDEAEYKKNAGTQLLEEDSVQKVICITGTRHRMGVTHCTLLTANTLCKSGYLVAIVDYSGAADYVKLAHSHGLDIEEDGHFQIEGIDIYINLPSQSIREKRAYHYIIYDMEPYDRIDMANKASVFYEAAERILISGSKPWELDELWAAVSLFKNLQVPIKYLFNMVSPSSQEDISKRMKKAGADEKDVSLLEYLPEFFSESERIRQVLNVKSAQSKKGRRGFFRF